MARVEASGHPASAEPRWYPKRHIARAGKHVLTPIGCRPSPGNACRNERERSVRISRTGDSVSPFVLWLDQTLGPPWSGLVMIALVGSLSAFSAYVAIQTIHYVYRDKP